MVGSKIRALREELGMSSSQLAEAAGLSQSAISQIERGITDPSLRTLRAVAEALNTPIFAFFLIFFNMAISDFLEQAPSIKAIS